MTDRQITHGHDCWGWGPKHYECAVAEIERLREQLAAAPQPQVQHADECGFTELTEKVAEIELAALEEALVKREKALAKWKVNESIGMDEELEAIHKEFHAACYAGRIQNVVYVLKAALADISRLRKAIECSRPIDDSSAAPHNKHVAAFDNMINDMTLHDYFAAKALPEVLAQKDVDGHTREWENAAWISYDIADAMLKIREASND